jgi:hypothetical protein
MKVKDAMKLLAKSAEVICFDEKGKKKFVKIS